MKNFLKDEGSKRIREGTTAVVQENNAANNAADYSANDTMKPDELKQSEIKQPDTARPESARPESAQLDTAAMLASDAHPRIAGPNNLPVNPAGESTFQEDVSVQPPGLSGDQRSRQYSREPQVTGRFVGREDILASIHQQFASDPRRAVAVAGISGVGKTELALQYAWQHKEAYPGGICWIGDRNSDVFTPIVLFAQHQLGMKPLPADSQQGTEESSDLIADPLSLSETALYYLRNWQQPGTALLIIDDVISSSVHQKQKQLLIEQLPEQFRCLLTIDLSRPSLKAAIEEDANDFVQKWPRQKRPLAIQELSILGREESLSLLSEFVGLRVLTAKPAAKSLCKKVGYLPIAIRLLGGYFSTSTSLSVGEVSLALTRQSQSLLPPNLPATGLATVDASLTELTPPELAIAENGVWAAYELCWQQMDETTQTLCHLLSFCAAGELSWTLVEFIASQAKLTEAQVVTAGSRIQNMLPGSTDKTLRLHPLSLAFLRAKLSQYAEQRLSGQALSAYEHWQPAYIEGLVEFAATIQPELSPADLSDIALSVGQLKAALSEPTIDQVPDEQLELLFSGVARFYSALSVFSEALSWAERSHEVLCDRLGENHPQTINALNTLGDIYTRQDRFAEAETLYLDALNRRKQQLGEADPDLAKGLNNLANVYCAQHRYDEAQELYVESLKVSQRHLGANHPSIATGLNNLALLHLKQGRFNEAEKYYLKALEITKSNLGTSHLTVAKSCNSLANVYASQGKFEQAEQYYQQDLRITQKNLGDNHIEVANSLNNLALLYKAQGRLSEAEPLYKRALDITQNKLGNRHPTVAKNLNNLANVYSAQKRFSEAEPLYKKAWTITQTNLGKDHPDVATSLNNLALLYKTQNRFSEAEPLYVQALGISERSFSNNPPILAASLNNLANVYVNQNRFDEAEPLYKRALQITEQQLDQSPMDVATSLNNLAHLYKMQRRYGEAESLCLQSIEMNKNTLGETHPAVAKSINNLAFLYQEQGRFNEAETLFTQAMNITKNSLGENHPEMIVRVNNLADLRRSRKRRKIIRIFRFILLALLASLLLHALFTLSQSATASSFARLVFVIFLGLTVWFLQAIFLK